MVHGVTKRQTRLRTHACIVNSQLCVSFMISLGPAPRSRPPGLLGPLISKRTLRRCLGGCTALNRAGRASRGLTAPRCRVPRVCEDGEPEDHTCSPRTSPQPAHSEPPPSRGGRWRQGDGIAALPPTVPAITSPPYPKPTSPSPCRILIP